MNLITRRQENQELLDYSKYGEIRRIMNIPVEPDITEEQIEYLSSLYVNGEAYQNGYRLLKDQARAILAYLELQGAFCPIAVGGGKTLTSLIIANDAFTKFGLRKVMLVIPPQLVDQLTKHDIPSYRRKTPITYPISVLAGRKRKQISESNRKGLYIVPYSLFSSKDTVDMLEAIAPELIIFDEAHLVCGNSARTKRIRNYITLHNPQVVAMSGTITKKSPNDYAFLARASLKECNFLPNTLSLATEWSAVIGADVSSLKEYRDAGIKAPNPGPILPLVDWAKDKFPNEAFDRNLSGFRKAYKHRMMTCKGVVSSGDNTLGISLEVKNNPVTNHTKAVGWDKLKELMDQVKTEAVTPNGDEIEHAMHGYKWLSELSAGFYNELIWPTPEKYASRKSINLDEAEEIIERAIMHHEAGQIYASTLRHWLTRHPDPHLDTPMLVGQSMHLHQDKYVSKELYSHWRDWKDLDFEGRPDRDAFAVRVCPYKIDQAAEWAMSLPEGVGGIIWYHHQAIGQWLNEALTKAGCKRSIFCPAGKQFNSKVIDLSNRDKILIASVPAHGTGKNLQHFQEQWYMQFPRPATTAEQVMGRLHRTGQEADHLVVNTNFTIEFDHVTFSATLNDSIYVHSTVGNRQKLVYADYVPLPEVVPREVQIEWGTDPHKLDADMEEELSDKFRVKLTRKGEKS